MCEPAYNEPWRTESSPFDWSVDDASGGEILRALPRINGQKGEVIVARVTRCVNLLKNVPDDAPCFTHKDSTEIGMALATLAGEYGAAAALADLLAERYAIEFTSAKEVEVYFDQKQKALWKDRSAAHAALPPPDAAIPPPPIRVGERVLTVREIGPLNPDRFGYGRMLPPGVGGVVIGLMATDGFAVDTEYGQLYIEERDLIPVRTGGYTTPP